MLLCVLSSALNLKFFSRVKFCLLGRYIPTVKNPLLDQTDVFILITARFPTLAGHLSDYVSLVDHTFYISVSGSNNSSIILRDCQNSREVKNEMSNMDVNQIMMICKY